MQRLHTLTIESSPYKTICYALGGIHKAIQVLDILEPQTQFFHIPDLQKLRGHKITGGHFLQCSLTEKGLIRWLPAYGTWVERDLSEVQGFGFFMVSEYLDELEYAINHSIHIPENVYFQTIDRIKALRSQ